MRFKVVQTGNAYLNVISYSDKQSNQRAFGLGSWDGKYLANFNTYSFFNKRTVLGEIIEYTQNGGNIELSWGEGSETKTMSGTFTCPHTLIIGGCNRDSGVLLEYSGAVFSNYRLVHNGITKNFVPYISQTQGMGMLDLVNGVFHPNMGTGTFTELIESPA